MSNAANDTGPVTLRGVATRPTVEIRKKNDHKRVALVNKTTWDTGTQWPRSEWEPVPESKGKAKPNKVKKPEKKAEYLTDGLDEADALKAVAESEDYPALEKAYENETREKVQEAISARATEVAGDGSGKPTGVPSEDSAK